MVAITKVPLAFSDCASHWGEHMFYNSLKKLAHAERINASKKCQSAADTAC